MPDIECDGEGFYFRYFMPDKKGKTKETKANATFVAAENIFLEKLQDVLGCRPDLLEELNCIENGLEVRLFQGAGFHDYENEIYLFGRVTQEDGQMVLELATDEIFGDHRDDHEVLDVVIHELIHVLDFIRGDDGYLPGWTDEDIKIYKKARTQERKKIRTGVSPMDEYALVNDMEFLAVLAETYFIKPKALKKSNPDLFILMKRFFEEMPTPPKKKRTRSKR